MTFVSTALPKFHSIPAALDAIAKEHQLGTITGGSGKGWSYYSTLMKCPRAFYYRNVEPDSGGEGIVQDEVERPARDFGSVVHAFLKLYYDGIIADRAGEPFGFFASRLYNALLEHQCNPEIVEGAWRVFNAYCDYYEPDYLDPLATEATALDKKNHSCRFDLIARIPVGMNTCEYSPGVYIVEHKTASRFSQDVLDGWDLDGEIQGQIAIWNASKRRYIYGELKGVMVNVLGKQKIPEFHRVVVSPQSFMYKKHLKVLGVMDGVEKRYRRLGARRGMEAWPQYMAACIDRWGRCDYYDRCRNEGLG